MIHRLLLALLCCLLALAAPVSAHTPISGQMFGPPPVTLFGVEFSIEQDCGPLTLHLAGLHDLAGPCRGVLVRQNPWSRFDPLGLSEADVRREMAVELTRLPQPFRAIAQFVGADKAVARALITGDAKLTAQGKSSGSELSWKDTVAGTAEGSAPAATIASLAVAAAAGPAVLFKETIGESTDLPVGVDDLVKGVKAIPDLVSSARKIAQGADEALEKVLPKPPENPITVQPGEMQTVDPKRLTSGQRDSLAEHRLEKQKKLIEHNIPRKDGPIEVHTNGVLHDGHHGAAAAAKAGKPVKVRVVPGEGVSKTNLPPHKLPIHKEF
jgi:hypothetical protein